MSSSLENVVSSKCRLDETAPWHPLSKSFYFFPECFKVGSFLRHWTVSSQVLCTAHKVCCPVTKCHDRSWISAQWQVRFHLQKISLHFGRWCTCDNAAWQPQRIRVQNSLILALKTTEDIPTQSYRQSSGRGICCKTCRLSVTVLMLHTIAKLVASFN